MADSKRESREVFGYSGGDNEVRIQEDESHGVGSISVKIDVDVSDALTGLKAVQREAREAAKALREVEAESGKVKDVNDLRDIQGQDGNWNYSEYMRGLYNGLELASATLERRDPEYKLRTFDDLKAPKDS